jgi:selenide, water dikinase
VLRPLESMVHPDLIVGTETGDDAAVWRRPDGRALVATVDFFAPIVDDAATWGRIAAANSASDVYAMGGTPMFGLNIVVWPRDTLPLELLSDVLGGMMATARDGGWIVAGGHTVDGPEPMVGQVVVGELPSGVDPITNAGAQAGDVLILTKPLGSGVLATAHKRLPAEAIAAGGRLHDTYNATVAAMCTLNDRAGAAAVAAGVHAGTDVTGFGLAGHLHKMMVASGVAAQLDLDVLPVIPGVRELIDEGFVPAGTLRNLEFVSESIIGGTDVDHWLIADPQTSGGLLVACPPDRVARFLVDVPGSVVVGDVSDSLPSGTISLR